MASPPRGRRGRLSYIGDLTLGAVLVALGVRLLGCAGSDEAARGPTPEPDTAVRALDTVPRVASYELRATVDPAAHVVDGEGTLTFTNTTQVALSEIYVHLYLNAFANDKTRFLRKSASGFRGSTPPSTPGSIEVLSFKAREWNADVWPASPTTEGDADDKTDIRVPLPQSIAPGQTVHFDMHFRSHLPSVVLRTGFFESFHMVAQWFPKIAKLEPDGTWAHFPFERFSEFYADFGDYDVTIGAPADFRIAAVGEETESWQAAGKNYERYHAGAVHDFSFAAWNGFDEMHAQSGDVAIRCFYPRGFRADAERELKTVADALPRYGARYGAYPYSTLTIVHPPDGAAEAGGMEYPTLITTGGPFWLAASQSRAIELLTLHELAHQWFYGLVATNEHDSPFLDEGGATYAAGQMSRELYGDTELTPLLPLAGAAGERLYAEGVASHADVAARADEFATGSDYGRLVYYRAATTMRTIDRVYDGAFGRALARYAREQRFEHPKPERLIEAIAKEGGPSAEAFAREALFQRGSVDYSASLSTDGRGTVHRAGTIVLPVDIVATLEDGSVARFDWDGAGDAYALDTGGRPIRDLVVDPSGRVLLDENLLNNRATRRPEASPRVASLGVFLGQLAAGGLAP